MNNLNLHKYKNIYELFANPGNSADTIFRCAICGKEIHSFHSNHLKTHNITKGEYVNQYGLPNQYYERKYLAGQLIDKLYFLYITNTKKWIYLSSCNNEYVTVVSSHENARILNVTDVKKHLLGYNTIGIFPLEKCSNFLIFDIDAYTIDSKGSIINTHAIDTSSNVVEVYATKLDNNVYNAMEIVYKIRHFLRGYFPKDQIHVSNSGNKGYHIELFFDKTVAIADLAKVFGAVLSEIRIQNYKGINIEMRPELSGINGRGIKLPCGVNHKNKDNKTNYCCFLDDNLEPIQNEVEYVLNIKKSAAVIIDKIIKDYSGVDLSKYRDKYAGNKNRTKKLISSQAKDTSKTAEYDTDTCNSIIFNRNYNYSWIESCLKYGLNQQGTRHDISFHIGLYLKQKGLNQDEAEKVLCKWSLEQKGRGFSSSSIHEITKDVHLIIRDIFNDSKNYNLRGSNKNISIGKNDLLQIQSVFKKTKDSGVTVINHQKLLYTLIVQSKRYADNDGNFYMTYDQIMQSTGFGCRTNTFKLIGELVTWGYIEVVSRNKQNPKDKKKNLPNVYRLNFHDDADNTPVFKICSNKDICNDCYYCMLKQCYTAKGLDNVVTRRVKKDILSTSIEKCITDNK